jgi:ERCC4-type nuclease
MSAPCLFDDREHGLRELLPQWPIAHLPVADIWIGVSQDSSPSADGPVAKGIMIERKSAADLEASILDGRYREQRSRLMTYATEKKAHVAYIIEGELDRLGATLTKQALMKHITRLALRYKIAVFQTACLKETAELCALLRDQWTTDPTTFEQPTTMTYIETRGKSRQENSDDPAVFATSVLQACRGISSTGAQAILAVFKNLEGIMAATEQQFAAVQVGKQKLGQVKAARLYSLLHSQ